MARGQQSSVNQEGAKRGGGQRWRADGDGLSEADDSVESSTLSGQQTPDRHARISEAAYRRAERRGFAPGGEWDDWLAAEREINADQVSDSTGQAEHN
jgi:hypothetical protein